MPESPLAISVTVLLFAAYRERVGRSTERLVLEPDATVEGAFEAMRSRYPALAPLRKYTTFAVNREVVPADQVLVDGDEVAFLQPVSGGCI